MPGTFGTVLTGGRPTVLAGLSPAFRAELIDLLVDVERVTAFQRITGKRGPTSLDTVDVVDFEIHFGRITEVTVYQSDTYAFDQFWDSRE